MNLKSYFDRRKKEMFPNITDWYDPQDQFRYEGDVNKLSQKQWFFFHPSAFKLINYGMHVSSSAIFCFVAIHFFRKGYDVIGFIAFIIAILNIRKLWLKLKKNHPKMTFYDLWMREYEGDEE